MEQEPGSREELKTEKGETTIGQQKQISTAVSGGAVVRAAEGWRDGGGDGVSRRRGVEDGGAVPRGGREGEREREWVAVRGEGKASSDGGGGGDGVLAGGWSGGEEGEGWGKKKMEVERGGFARLRSVPREVGLS
ncbi:glycine-rich protein 2-like [Arachis ipaensis]|uniref:glycine-rich protein 2-like n=1 Tax=Arachis ipaensis TaxID=130454 RepID=UPI0007AF71EB|nr:glycine-rich protein 2-like [Arachis ipaensis]